MSNAPRTAENNSETLPADFMKLAGAIEAMPAESRDQLMPLLVRVSESTKRRRRILSLVQDALSQLRLDMKYLMFDLEATRRERDDLAERLRNNEVDGGDDELDIE